MLQEIVSHRRSQVAQSRIRHPEKALLDSPHLQRTPLSLQSRLIAHGSSGIIAEFKRRSPSRGYINKNADILDITAGYVRSGAAALSILTEPDYFAGSERDLILARAANVCPILRKDFLVDEYQVLESRAWGADAILLIAAVLDSNEVSSLYRQARSLDLEVLFEIHHTDDLDKLPGTDLIVGVNNRNLQTMRVDIRHSLEIVRFLPEGMTKIAESGIQTPDEWFMLRDAGYDGCLIGGQLMQFADPGLALHRFISGLDHLQHSMEMPSGKS